MTIRPAEFCDINQLVALIEEMHRKSRYIEVGPVDVKETKRFLVQSIQRHGAQHDGGTLVLVSEEHGMLHGFIVGILARVYHLLEPLEATDLFWYANGNAPKGDALGLYDQLVAWAEANPKVAEIRAGVTDAINDERRAEAFFKRRGFRHSGTIYERIIER